MFYYFRVGMVRTISGPRAAARMGYGDLALWQEKARGVSAAVKIG